MTAVLSPTSSSPSSSPRPPPSAAPNPNLSALPPIVTSGQRTRAAPQRHSSYARDRMSTYSVTSNTSQKVSRPTSSIIPIFRSSLPYTKVRDFAYPLSSPLHFGPPPISSAPPSGQSTPAFESQLRLGDPPRKYSDPVRSSWTRGAWSGGDTEHLPQVAYSAPREDHGPPYSEDEDLQSPVVMTSRHRKHPSGTGDDPRSPDSDTDRGYFTGINGDGSETYYVSEVDEMADGPGGELVTYPPSDPRHSSTLQPSSHQSASGLQPGTFHADESRYSRDYQFTIASPDEEMHGKAVALFDFARENENELPLVEGQVIWVSYRHGQGWLVAEDPRTQESGLVPEEYVRLLRDIEGGWSSLSAEAMGAGSPDVPSSSDAPRADSGSTADVTTPTASDAAPSHQKSGSTGSNGEKHPPVVSTFSTSSRDLDHYPHPLLGTQTGQTAPPVVHYGSQASTPTVRSPSVAKKDRERDKDAAKGKGREEKEKGKEIKRTASKQQKKAAGKR